MIIQLSLIKRNRENMGQFKTHIGFGVISLELLEHLLEFVSFICLEEASQICNNLKSKLGFRFYVDSYIRALRKYIYLQEQSIF